MKVVFVGSSTFGKKCLKLLVEMDCCEIKGVITNPRKFSVSYNPKGVKNVLHSNIPLFCKKNCIDYINMETNANDNNILKKIHFWRPDVFIVVGWYHIVPKKWRNIAPAYGMHASLLPRYSGGAPLVWAIINGEKKTGITLFKMDDGVDSGPIVGQLEESIFEDDTIKSLYYRIEKLGIKLLRKYIPIIATGTVKLKKQDESKRTTFPQRSPEDGEIDWNWDLKRIKNFIRAQTKPYPGAYTIINNKKVVFWDVDILINEK